MQSVVLIEVLEKKPHFAAPWRAGSLKRTVCSGFLVLLKERRLVLTNAHCVQFAVKISVVNPRLGTPVAMEVMDLGSEMDLALLSPVEHGELPRETLVLAERDPLVGETVRVLGFPNGGSNPSHTKGVVSRYMETCYNSSRTGLAVQIDAAVNPGNSGGPVLSKKREVIGVAFAHGVGMENTCFMVPVSLVKHYLRDVKTHGRSTAVPGLNFSWVNCANPTLRRELLPRELAEGETGVLVRRLHPRSGNRGRLEPGDVILEVEGKGISSSGNLLDSPPEQGRIPFWQQLRGKFVGESCEVKLVRKGKVLTQTLVLEEQLSNAAPQSFRQINLHYYVFGGLVFMALNRRFLMKNPVPLLMAKGCEVDGEVVFLAELLETRFTTGYNWESFKYLPLRSVNNTEIHSLRELFEFCEDVKEELIKFQFEMENFLLLDWREALEHSPELAEELLGVPYHNFLEEL